MDFRETAKKYYSFLRDGEYDLANDVKREYKEQTGMTLSVQRDFIDVLVWQVDGEGNYLRLCSCL